MKENLFVKINGFPILYNFSQLPGYWHEKWCIQTKLGDQCNHNHALQASGLWKLYFGIEFVNEV